MSKKVAGNSKQELLEWMTARSVTFGWGAIIAVDRETANTTFRQQYIEAFTHDSYLPEISTTTHIVGDHYRLFDDCVLTQPVVSFVDSKITDSEPVVNLAIDITHGREVTVVYGPGKPKAQKISEISAINATTLSIRTGLEKKLSAGVVGDVVVDLKNGTRYELSSGSTDLETALTGDSFRDEFRQWADEQRVWLVNRIDGNEGAFAIKDFALRCQRAPGAATRGAQNYGDGAAVAFIEFQNGGRGTFPSTEDSLKYLVPGDDDQRYTVTTIVEHNTFLKMLATDLFRASSDRWIAYGFEYDNAVQTGNVINFSTGGVKRINGPWSPDQKWNVTLEAQTDWAESDTWIFYNNDSAFNKIAASLSWVESPGSLGELTFNFDMNGYEEHLTVSSILSGWPDEKLIHAYLNGKVATTAKVALDVSRQTITASHARSAIVPLGIELGSYNSPISQANLKAGISHIAEESFAMIAEGFDGREAEVCLLPLNSLFFSGNYVTRLTEAATPNDLVMFGHVSIDDLAFEVDQPVVVMGSGRTHSFSLVGSNIGVTFSVVNLPGEEGLPKGTIDAQTGFYTAPSADQINGPQTRVKIVVHRDLVVASALVTVVRNEVSINPLVQFVSAGSSCELVAGVLNSAAKTWGPIDPARGSLSDSTVEGRDKTFTAPPATPGVVLDVVPVTVSAPGATATAYVGVLHGNTVLSIETGAIDPSGRSVALEAWMGAIPSPLPVQWRTVGLAGAIDANGVLTVEDNPAEPFVLVIAEAVGMPAIAGYLLLPLPLAEFAPRPTAADPAQLTLG